MDIQEWCGDERLDRQEPVASLLRAAAAPSEPGPQPGEEAALAAFRATRQTIGRTRMRSTRMKAVLAASVSAGVLLTGGVAAAATGSLPGPAQDVLSRVGLHAQGGDHAADETADQQDQTTEPADEVAGTDQKATDDPADATDTEDATTQDSTQSDTDSQPSQDTQTSQDGDQAASEHPTNHGAHVSEVAKGDKSSDSDVNHGAAVSTVARQNAGQQHAKSGDAGDSSEHKSTEPGTERSDNGTGASTAKGDSGKQGDDAKQGADDTDEQDASAGAQTDAQAGH